MWVISSEDVLQWAGVSIGSVIQYVMVAHLSYHNKYIKIPTVVDSDDTELSRSFVKARTCPGWWNGILATDGSILLFQKLGYFDETVYDRKTTYSLNCQICTNYIHCSVLIQLTACCHATWLMCHQLWSWPSRQCAWCTCLLGNGDYKQSRRVTPSITLGLGQ